MSQPAAATGGEGAAAAAGSGARPSYPTPPVIHFATGNKKKLEEVRKAWSCG